MRHLAVCAVLAFGLSVSSCQPGADDVGNASNRTSAIDPLATAYVKLSLRIGAQEPGYIDAYYGPKQWQPDPQAGPEPRDRLLAETRKLLAQVEQAGKRVTGSDEQRRARFLAGQLRAAETRLLMGGRREIRLCR